MTSFDPFGVQARRRLGEYQAHCIKLENTINSLNEENMMLREEIRLLKAYYAINGIDDIDFPLSYNKSVLNKMFGVNRRDTYDT